jgi:hypothetical protein
MDPAFHPLLKTFVVCLPLYYIVWKFIFGSWDEFLDALRFWFTPGWLSLLRGEFGSDLFAAIKLIFFAILCVGSTMLIYEKVFFKAVS